jgi:hypothetical protein
MPPFALVLLGFIPIQFKHQAAAAAVAADVIAVDHPNNKSEHKHQPPLISNQEKIAR